jgi:hypothetical protein
MDFVLTQVLLCVILFLEFKSIWNDRNYYHGSLIEKVEAYGNS